MLGLFAWRAWHREDAVLQIRLLKDRNLAMSSALMFCFGLSMYGTMVLQPLLMEYLLGYPAVTTGLAMVPRGVASALGMVIVGRFLTPGNSRAFVVAGLVSTSLSTYFMTWYSLEVDTFWIVWPTIFQGIALGMIFVPLSTLAYQTLAADATDQASSIFSLARSAGAAVGISSVIVVMSRANQVHWNTLGGHLTPFNPALTDWLAVHQLSSADPTTPRFLAMELGRQASMNGYLDAFWFITVGTVAMIPFAMLMRRPKAAPPSPSLEEAEGAT